MTEHRPPHPVRVDAQLDRATSRWSWLSLVPHHVVLTFLRLGFVLAGIVAYPGLRAARYPPSRLDQGGTDPGSGPAVPPAPGPTGGAGSDRSGRGRRRAKVAGWQRCEDRRNLCDNVPPQRSPASTS